MTDISKRLSVEGPDSNGDYELTWLCGDCDRNDSDWINRAQADALIAALQPVAPQPEAGARGADQWQHDQKVRAAVLRRCAEEIENSMQNPVVSDRELLMNGINWYRAQADNMDPVPAPPVSTETREDLHSAIMNLRDTNGAHLTGATSLEQAYQMGHRDARHVAAELVAASVSRRDADHD